MTTSNCSFSHDEIVTSLYNGTIIKLKDGEIVCSVQLSKTETLIKVITDDIVATVFGAVMILNGELKLVRRLETPTESWAKSIEANEEFIAVGYYNGNVCFFDRKKDDEPTVRTEKNIKVDNIN